MELLVEDVAELREPNCLLADDETSIGSFGNLDCLQVGFRDVLNIDTGEFEARRGSVFPNHEIF